MLSDRRMGTPDAIIVPKLRVKRAMATFLSRSPKTGSRSFSGSTTARTDSLFLFLRHQTANAIEPTTTTGTMKIMALEMTTRICVGSGSSEPRSSNIFWKIGTMNSSMPNTARIAMISTTTG